MIKKIFVAMLTILTVSGIMVEQNGQGFVTDGACSGDLSYFLCNCYNNTSKIDLYLGEGDFNLTKLPQSSYCLLNNKINITISGIGNGTKVRCNSFALVFLNSSNIVIQNIQFINCGYFVDESIKELYRRSSKYSYFGEQSRAFIILYDSINMSARNVSMEQTLGYGIILINALGFVEFREAMIVNTTFENDRQCMNYKYSDKVATHLCSGSGIVFIYHNDGKKFNITDNVILIDHCVFKNNKNALPSEDFNGYNNLVNSGLFKMPLPVIGAASITFIYAQTEYNVTSNISNSIFHNNNGSVTASVAITAISSPNSKTNFDRCLFLDNNRQGSDLDNSQLYHRGGINFYYLKLLEFPLANSIAAVEMLSILHSNFTLLGGRYDKQLGVAIHIEKISPDYLSIIAIIKQCNFVANEVNTGSAIYAKDTPFYLSSNALTSGRLLVKLEDINLVNNTAPLINLYYASGIVYFSDCHVSLTCNELCEFMHNLPSVLYGQNGELSVAGNLSFQHNGAYRGGAIILQNTVLYIKVGSTILISYNYAHLEGGGIYIRFFNRGFQAKDICPIQIYGHPNLIKDYDSLSNLNLNITFEENYIGDNSSIESINANVFYLCTWNLGTSIGIPMDLLVPVENNTRQSVYHEIFNFNSHNMTDHVYVFALVSCPCDKHGNYSHNTPTCLTGGIINWSEPVIPGWDFSINLTALTVVGDIGYAQSLSSKISGENVSLVLENDQLQRPFSVDRTACTPVEFTVYLDANDSKPANGLLTLELNLVFSVSIKVSVHQCPRGYNLQKKSNDESKYGCVCDIFFMERHVRTGFQCSPGTIIRNDVHSWLGVIQNNLEYMESCLPTHCNDIVKIFNVSLDNLLCTNNHAGRACGGCVDGYSRVFGSSVCKQCSNVWLTTILLYGLLGVLLVFLIYKLQLTVTLGAINGLVFFCNCMSINEELFFNAVISEFSFLRIFVSLINLELGFEVCFYDGMSQLAKTGLQFVFPIYFGLLMLVIVFFSKFYNIKTFSQSSLSILATLIVLSYLKLLRTGIEIFSFLRVHSAKDGILIVWSSDPNIKYFTGGHIALLLTSLLFFFLFIVPFAVGFTFPKVVLRSKRLSYFFPLVDCFVAPYKDKYRYWFGVRVLVLVVLSIVDAVVVQFTEVVLVTSITGVGLFALVQAYIHPFKNTLIDTLDLMFMEIFLLLSALTLYFYPSVNGYDDVNIVVTVFGYCAFTLFCLLILHQLHNICKNKMWYFFVIRIIRGKHEQLKKIKKHFSGETAPTVPIRQDKVDIESIGVTVTYNHYRESLLEYF